MDKTDNKTETKSDKSNRNKERLPFTDSAIQKWLPGFSERGYPRFIEIPFNVKNIPHLKGFNTLYLFQKNIILRLSLVGNLEVGFHILVPNRVYNR